MLNKKIPVKRKLTNKIKILKKDFKLVKKDDGGEILNSYKYDLLNENKTSEENKSEEFTREIPEDHFIKLTTKMFPKWSKTDTKIARFMKNLDPRKIYTENEINEYGLRIVNLQTYKIRNNGIGIILKALNNGYQLYPELVKAFEENF